MNQQVKTKVFLLGGADLEMVTIREILLKDLYKVVDKELKWSNAVLGAYAEELKNYASDNYIIYGIELQDDGTVHPNNYVRIDHHNELQCKPSSLEQVAHLLSHKLTFDERLIASNDKGYYSAMKKILDEEKPELSELKKQRVMDEIRRMDRVAQGVSEEEEIMAESICREEKYEKTSFCTFVEVPQKMSFSPITDRLWPYERLVVYSLYQSGVKLCYYGKDAERVLDSVKKRFEYDIEQVEKGLMPFYSGGGTDGYWGIKENLLPEKLVRDIVDYIKAFNRGSSCHLFYFPFVWSGIADLEKLENAGKWERVRVAKNCVDKYDERNYFYKFVNEKLYDAEGQLCNGLQIPQVFHYRRVIGGNARYIIEAKGSVYDLKINYIEVKLYTTGVGLIAYNLENDNNLFLSPDDVLNINQFGRRVFPPFYADLDYHDEIAKSITITGVDETDIREDFDEYKENPECWTAGKIVSVLLNDLLKGGVYEPVTDDRMFVMSWYKNTPLVINAVKDYSSDKDFWYRYLYVDKGLPMCQDEEMRDALIKEHTYRRFAKWGTLYGITRYSMVMLTEDNAPDYLLNTFTSIYARMVELVLMQRASVLKFSKEVNDINNIESEEKGTELFEKTAKLCREYINFKNQFYFKEVTAQEQGIELYDMLQQSLRLDVMVKDLDEDIQELYQYNSILEERESNKAAADLNVILGTFTPAAFLVSVLAFGHWAFNNVFIDKAMLLILTLVAAVPLLLLIKWIYKMIKSRK